jgi:hypothetical protein
MYLIWSSVLISFSPHRLAAMPENPRPRSAIFARNSRLCDFAVRAPGQSPFPPPGLPGFGCGGNAPSSTPSKPSALSLVQTVSKSIGLDA